MPYFSILFQLVNDGKAIARLVLFIGVAIERMEQIEIEIFNAADIELGFKQRQDLLLGLEKPI